MSVRRGIAGAGLLAVAAAVVALTTASLVDASSGGGHGGEEGTGTTHEHGADQPRRLWLASRPLRWLLLAGETAGPEEARARPAMP
ncbi:hypothetical protein DCC78_02215 [bacterium]|nr:MAG: hypothetical protein DCC78_02215 [bacterium]